MVEYEDIVAARRRIEDMIAPTPVLEDFTLGEALGCTVRLKGELFQRTGSFKPRGGLNWVRTATKEELQSGLGAVSAGNHAAALAWAAREAGLPLTVVMPANASPFKVEATRNFGARVLLEGDINDAWALMRRLLKEQGLTLVHPFDNPRIIAGQGTVGLEIMEQVPRCGTIVCPVGGGGLISGIAVAARHLRPDVRVIGVEPEGAATMRHAWDRGGPSPLPVVRTCAWSLGAPIAGEYTYALSRRHVHDIVTVPEHAIHRAMRHLMAHAKLFPEAGAAVGVAALMERRIPAPAPDRDVVAVITGGNIGWEELRPFVCTGPDPA